MLFHLVTLLLLRAPIQASADALPPQTLTPAVVKTQVDECPDCDVLLDPKNSPLIKSLIDETTSVTQTACRVIRDSKECRDVAQQIDKGGEKSQDYMRSCSANEVLGDVDNLYELGDTLAGCAMGIADFAWLDFYKSVKALPKTVGAIPSAVFGLVDNGLAAYQSADFCDHHPDLKILMYKVHNENLPADLQVKIPEHFNRYTCSQLKDNIYQESRYLTVQKLLAAGYHFKTEENTGLLKFVKSKMDEWGVRVNCYNPRKSKELICKSAAYAISTAILAPAMILKLRVLAGLIEVSDVSTLAKVQNVTSKIKTAANTGASGVSDVDEVKTPSKAVEAAATTQTDGQTKVLAEAAVHSAPAVPLISKTKFIIDYGKKLFYGKKQNVAFIRVAKDDVADGVTLFAHEENSYLKIINKVFGKSFGTAVTNKRKEILIKEMEELAKKFNVKVLPYSDYKSLRFAFRAKNGGKLPPEFERELSAAFDRGNKEFVKFLLDNKLVKANSNPPPDRWFHLGIGDTGPEAAGTADKAKQMVGENRVVSYREKWVKDGFEEDRVNAQKYFEEINNVEKFRDVGIVEQMPFTHQVKLTDDVIDYLRKIPDATELKAQLSKVYGVELTDPEVELLQKYYKSFDAFMPAQLIEERVIANLDDAHFGGLGFDFRGLGATGRSHTAQAITVSKDVPSARYVSGLNEDSYTKWINVQKRRLKKVISEEEDKANLKHKENETGDEVNSFGTEEAISEATVDKIAKRLAARKNPSQIRMVFIPNGVESGELRQAWLDFGDNLIKDAREAVKGPTTRVPLDKVFLYVKMDKTTPVLGVKGADETLTAKLQEEFKKLLESRKVPTKESINSKPVEVEAEE